MLRKDNTSNKLNHSETHCRMPVWHFQVNMSYHGLSQDKITHSDLSETTSHTSQMLQIKGQIVDHDVQQWWLRYRFIFAYNTLHKSFTELCRFSNVTHINKALYRISNEQVHLPFEPFYNIMNFRTSDKRLTILTFWFKVS